MLKELRAESAPAFEAKTMNDWLEDARKYYKAADWFLNAVNTADPYIKRDLYDFLYWVFENTEQGQVINVVGDLQGTYEIDFKSKETVESLLRKKYNRRKLPFIVRYCVRSSSGMTWSASPKFKVRYKHDEPHYKYNGHTKRKAISKTVRYKLLVQANFKCKCGRSPATHPGCTLEIDHIIPVSKGGSNDESNLQVLCFQCNRGKRDNIF